MGLTKAFIQPDKGQGKGEPIKFLFNPNQYGLDKGNQLAEIGIPGLAAPILQFVRGNARALTMELFFDTFEQQTDVRDHTDRVYGLLEIDTETHAPPLCTFTWGTFNLRCIVERVGGRFTLFLANGTPVRATLSVTLKEYVDVDLAARAGPTESSDHVKTRQLRRGDTLSSLAAAEYGDPAKWRPIAEANNIDNPRHVTAGRSLVLPPLS
jgi:nucleoid-associated protein YgaU